jgi:hypothetical protein
VSKKSWQGNWKHELTMNDLEFLINRYIDQTASKDEVAILNELLRLDVQARRIFVEHLNLDSALAEFAAGLPGKQAAVDDILVLNQRALFSNAFAYSLIALASAIALVTGSLLWFASSSRFHPISEPILAQSENPEKLVTSMAVLVDAADAQFVFGSAPRGNQLDSGDYELLAGIAHIRFASGAEMIVNAPAKWSVLDAMHVRMAFGKARVMAPPSAKGFSIVTPDAEYIDLGTEFGLDVKQQGNASDLYVFDGQVNVADQASKQVFDEVFEGETTRHTQGVAGPAPQMDSADFPTPNQIGLARWNNHMNRLIQDPSLVGFFPFRKMDDEAVLENQIRNVEPRSPNGRIVGARWVSGRWPGKDSLLFDGDHEYVELDIPGQFHQFTVAAWIKIDRLDFEMNAILNSDELQPGDVHFQITRQGLPKGGVQGGEVGSITKETYIGDPITIGNWLHVAMVISSTDRIRSVFANGKLVRKGEMSHELIVSPGSCRLGNWLPSIDQKEKRTRAFRGRIDELAIWNRALTESELRELFEAGRPNGLSVE